MRKAKTPSKADEALIGAVEALGGPSVTARQIERWRQAGAIPSSARKGLGRGGGSESAYPDGTAEQVVALVELLERHRNLPHAMLVLFARERPIGEAGLKDSFDWMFASMQEGMRRYAVKADPKLADQADVTEEMAEAAAAAFTKVVPRARVGRVMARNIRRDPGREESVESVMASAISNVVSMAALGAPLSYEGATEAVGALGYIPENEDEAMANILEGTERMAIPAAKAAVRAASLEELEMVRDMAVAVTAVIKERAPDRGAVNPVADPFEAALRMFALVGPLLGDLDVAFHTAMLLVLISATGFSIREEHRRLQQMKEEGSL